MNFSFTASSIVPNLFKPTENSQREKCHPSIINENQKFTKDHYDEEINYEKQCFFDDIAENNYKNNYKQNGFMLKTFENQNQDGEDKLNLKENQSYQNQMEIIEKQEKDKIFSAIKRVDQKVEKQMYKQFQQMEKQSNQIYAGLSKVASQMNLNEKLVESYYNRYNKRKNQLEEDMYLNSPNQSRKNQVGIYKKTEMFDSAIKRVLKETPFACINDLRGDIRSKEKLTLAKQTLIRRLKNLGYKYQKFTIKKIIKNRELDIEIRKIYAQVFKEIKSSFTDQIFHFGACHFTMNQFKGSMWMKVDRLGEPENIVEIDNLVTLITIMSPFKIEYFKVYEGVIKKQMYLESLEEWCQLIQTKRRDIKLFKSGFNSPIKVEKQEKEAYSKRIHLAIENNPIFNCEHHEDKKILQKQNSLKLVEPLFSPQLNPNNWIFKHIKYLVREEKPKGKEDIKKAIENVILKRIDLQDIKFAMEWHTKALEQAKLGKMFEEDLRQNQS